MLFTYFVRRECFLNKTSYGIQPHNWIDNCKSDGRAVLQHVRDGGSSPPNCLFNWTDDMYCAGKDQIASGARFVYVLDAVTVHIVI